eukprot:scaffold12252_cov93-Isochrysis_galbana.AAC.7
MLQASSPVKSRASSPVNSRASSAPQARSRCSRVTKHATLHVRTSSIVHAPAAGTPPVFSPISAAGAGPPLVFSPAAGAAPPPVFSPAAGAAPPPVFSPAAGAGGCSPLEFTSTGILRGASSTPSTPFVAASSPPGIPGVFPRCSNRLARRARIDEPRATSPIHTAPPGGTIRVAARQASADRTWSWGSSGWVEGGSGLGSQGGEKREGFKERRGREGRGGESVGGLGVRRYVVAIMNCVRCA